MPRNTKDSHSREEDEERDHVAPRVDETEVEDDDRARSKLDEENFEAGADADDEDLAEDIDLDDLSAMEGPDA